MKIRWGRLVWSIFVVLYLGLFFWNLFLSFPSRIIPTIYLYILIIWLSIEFYFHQSFFQSGRLITEDPETNDRYDNMSFALRSLFAIFFYSCLAIGVADFVWWNKGQVPELRPFINILGILILLGSVLMRIKSDLLMFRNRHKIIREGLYNSIRHPAYFTTLLLILSISCALSSFLILIYTLVIGLPLIYLEASFEDRYLAKKNGPDYEAYKEKTSLFIPGIL